MEKERSHPQWLWTITAIAGGLAVVVSILSMAIVFVVPQITGNTVTVILIGIGLVGLLLGIGLLATGLAGRKQWPSPVIYTKWGWAVCLALLIGVAGVAVVIPVEWHQRAVFAPLHL